MILLGTVMLDRAKEDVMFQVGQRVRLAADVSDYRLSAGAAGTVTAVAEDPFDSGKVRVEVLFDNASTVHFDSSQLENAD